MPEGEHPWESFRSHADDGEGRAVQANGASENGRVAREFAFPEIRPEDYDGVATRHLIFVFAKAATQTRLDAEHAEIIAGNQHAALDSRRGAGFCAEADCLHIGVGDYSVVAFRFVADVQVFAVGEIFEGAVMRGADEGDDAARMWNGVGPKNQPIDHAESCR